MTFEPITVTPAPAFRVAGEVVAVSPVSHGDGHLGTTTVFRTGKIVQPDGSTVDVPKVSGNGVRGRLRRVSADRLWHAIGQPQFTPEQFALVWQGGALTKRQKRVKPQTVREARELVPHLSMFGWSGGSRIVEGRSRVEEMVPLCDETAHILDGTLPGTVWDRLDLADMSRMEDRVRSPRGTDATDWDGEEDTSQMRFSTQVLSAGTRMQWAFSLVDATDLERAWARVVLTSWAAEGATVGGRSAAGFGRLRLDFGGWQATPQDHQLVADHHQKHAEEIVETISAIV